MGDSICVFCGKSFYSISSLNLHIRTAKYCLALRDEDSTTYSCSKCFREFTTEGNRNRHVKLCTHKMPPMVEKALYEKEMMLTDVEEKFVNLELDFENLKEELANMRKENTRLLIENAKLSVYKEEYTIIRDKPTTTNNTTNNNTNNKLKMVNTSTIDPFTVDLVKSRLENKGYSYGDFLTGESGIKRFIMGMIVKDDERNYVTTDTSRQNFHRFKETKKWGLDAGAKFLTNVFDEMKPLIREYWDKFNIEADNAKTVEEHESFDYDRDKIKPVVLAIEGSVDSKPRKELLNNVVKYIKPHVAV